MFIILAYDIHTKRASKVLKICRKYMMHVQKSVFEGDLTEAKLKKLKNYKFQYKKCHILSNKYAQHLSVFMEDV